MIKKILEILFSKKNDGFFKIITIFGIRFRFLRKKSFNNIFNEMQEIINLHNIKKIGINKEKIACEIENFTEYGITTTSGSPKLIVSLTSYPERMYDIHYCLYYLLTQKKKADKIVLWLGIEQFPNKEKDIPNRVLKLKENGLTIQWCSDIKSFTKLIPSLQAYPEDVIVTADDDIFYGPDWLDKLYTEYLSGIKKGGGIIYAHRCHKILINNKQILPYNQWEHCVQDSSISCLNFLTGVGGVLFPPNSLHKEVTDSQKFMQLCPLADDIWFWAMAVINGTRIKVLQNPDQLVYISPERELNQSEKMTLSSYNVANAGNDKQIRQVINHYPQISDLLKIQ